MNQAALHLRDSPRQEFTERARFVKIEPSELPSEGGEVQRGGDRACGYARFCLRQFPGQQVIPTLALRRRRKQGRHCRRFTLGYFTLRNSLSPEQ